MPNGRNAVYLLKELLQDSLGPLCTELNGFGWVGNVSTMNNQLHDSCPFLSLPFRKVEPVHLYARLKVLQSKFHRRHSKPVMQ